MKKLFDSFSTIPANGNGAAKPELTDIAVIGMSARIGGADNLEVFWQQLLAREDFADVLSAQRKKDLRDYLQYAGVDADTVRFKPGAFFKEIDLFDHGFFNISHLEACSMAPDQRIFLEETWHALEDAGYAGQKIRGSRTGIYLGYAREENQYLKMVTGIDPELTGMALTGNVASVMAGRVSHFLDLKGPAMLINTACSSSLVAIHHACQALRDHDCEMALTGGINLHLSPLQAPGDAIGLGVESANGSTRSFDDWSDGTGGGEGCVVLLLKPLHKALQDNDRIHAVIKGTAVNQDGSAINIAAPNVAAQEEVLVSAWKNARIDPQSLGYIEAHGTGTPLGDPIEVAAITAAFKRYTDRKQFCALSALKSNIGHLDAAAGAAGLLKAILSLQHHTIAPVAHFEKPNRHIPFETSPLYVNTRATAWDALKSPRRCGVSAFGLSGTNAHVVLEEAPARAVTAVNDTDEYRLFTISAIQDLSLRQAVINHLAWMKNNDDTLSNICYTASTGRAHFASRLALVADTKSALQAQLTAWLAGENVESVYAGNTTSLQQLSSAQAIRTLSAEALQWVTDHKGQRGEKAMLLQLAAWYVQGADVPWEELYAHGKNTIVALPLYPFQAKRCWVDVPEQVTVSQAIADSVPAQKSADQKITTAPPILEVPQVITATLTREEVFEEFRIYFSQAFDISAAIITPETNVYEIGLDSISIVQVRRLIKKQYNIDVPVIDLFKKFVKIGDLAAHIAGTLHTIQATQKVKAPAIKASVVTHAPEGSVQEELQHIRQRIDTLLHRLPGDTSGMVPAKPVVHYKPALKTLAKPVHAVSSAEVPDAGLLAGQEAYIDAFAEAYQLRTAKSLQYTLDHMLHFANNRNVSGFKKIYRKLQYTVIADHVAGSRIWDIDGNEYIDFAMGFGVHFMGHNHPRVRKALEIQLEKGTWLGPLSVLPGEVAAMISEITGAERVAFYNSGTEAVMVAIRLARAATGRNKIVIFSGSYHGMFDGLLATRNPYAETYETVAIANGILQAMVDDVYVLEYDDPAALEFIREHAGEIAAVVTEPVQSRRPELQPFEFLAALREATSTLGICLIFDEIITGFRILPGGSQQFFNVQADLVTYGKVVGGGLPLGIVAGKAEYLHGIDGGQWSPAGDTLPTFDHRRTIVAGTFCHHPLAMASAREMLLYIKEQGVALYERLNVMTTNFVQQINAYFIAASVPVRLYNFGSMFHFRSELDLKLFFYHLVHKGIYVWEGATFFISTVHTQDDLARFESAIRESIADLRSAGMMPVSEVQEVLMPAVAGNYFPLTGEQLKIWLRSQESPQASATFNELISFSLEGKAHEKAIVQSLQELMRRHRALSITGISAEAQCIPAVTATLPFTHISAIGDTPQERLQYAATWLRQEVQQPFAAGGLHIRASLVTCGEESCIFALIIHQVIADGYSLSLIQGELQTLYSAYCAGTTPELPVPAAFTDYLHRKGDTPAAAMQAFWSKDWELPFASPFSRNPFTPAGIYPKQWVNTIMPNVLYGGVKQFARAHHHTPFAVLLSAFTALTATFSNRKDVLIGIPAVGQLLLDNPHLVGQCMQLLSLRWELDNTQTAAGMIAGVAAKFNQLQEYRDFKIGDIITYATSLGKPCHMPVVRVVFNMDPPIQQEGITTPVTSIAFTSGEEALAKYDLFVNVVEVNKQLHFSFQYSTAVFSETGIKYWMDLYFRLLQKMTENPETNVNEYTQLLCNNAIQTGFASADDPLSELASRLAFPALTQVWLLPAGMLPEEIAVWQQMSKQNNWHLHVSGQAPTVATGPGWIICGDLQALASASAAQRQFMLQQATSWILVNEAPVSNLTLQQLAFAGNTVQLHLLTRLPGTATYFLHEKIQYRLQQPLELLPAGKPLPSFRLQVVAKTGQPLPPDTPGILLWENAGANMEPTGFIASCDHAGVYHLWAAGKQRRTYRGFELDEALVEAALQLHPQGEPDFLKIFLPKELLPERTITLAQTGANAVDPVRATQLLDCVCQVLKVPGLSLQDNFLEAGGTSIQAIHLITLLRHKMNLEVSPAALFTLPYLEALLWESAVAVPEEKIPVLDAQPYYPLSHAQQRFWIVEQLEESVHTAVLTETRRIYGPLDTTLFYNACLEVVKRHESLRTVFERHDEQVVQRIVVAGEAAFDYRFEDWQQRDINVNDETDALTSAELNTAFRLNEGPVFRVRLIQTGPQAFVTLFVTHHIIFDGWSFDVLMRDIITAYKHLLSGMPAFDTPLAFQLKDYSSWHNKMIADRLSQLQQFWKDQFKVLAPLLQWQTGMSRPALKNYRAGKQTLILEADISASLFRVGKYCKASMFMTVHAGLLSLLYCYTRNTSYCIGTPVADRQQEALQQQIGCFINTLPMPVSFKKEDNFPELLYRVREVTLDTFAHQQYPFERILKDVNYARDASRNPLFDIGYTFHETEYLSGMPVVDDLGIRSELVPPGLYSVKTDLWFHAAFDKETLAFTIIYDTALFTEAFMETLVADLCYVLETIALRPAITLEELLLRFQVQQRKRTDALNAQTASQQGALLRNFKKKNSQA